LLEYDSFVNPVQAPGAKGRSLYWGSIWISLQDKQIEHATLNEDILMEMGSATNQQKLLDIQREVVFSKIP
jgi:hypothetical protein